MSDKAPALYEHYLPERDYFSQGYKPFGKSDEDMCGRCEAYYAMLHEKGLTDRPFPPTCKRHITDPIKELTPEDFESEDEYERAVVTLDPISWAVMQFGWEARWYQEEMLSCCRSNTPIYMADGTLRQIKDVEVGDYVLTYDETGRRVFPKPVLRRINNGVRDVYRIWLENGDYLDCTSDHKIYSWSKCGKPNPFHGCPSYKSSYRSLDGGLSVGDRVFVLNSFDRYGSVEDIALAKLLGYIVTDGYVNDGKVVFDNTREEYVQEFEDCIKQVFPHVDAHRTYKPSGVYKGSKKKAVYKSRTNKSNSALADFLTDIGCTDKTNRELSIVDYAFKLSKEALRVFINRAWSGDGCVYTNKQGVSHLTLHSGNEEYLERFRLLLRKLGIQCSRVYTRHNKEGGTCKHISIGRVPDVETFFAEVGPVFGKEEESRIALEATSKREHYGTRRRFKTTSRFKIKSIELIGKEEVYDLEVEDRHNFFANGSVVHNCTAKYKVMRCGRRIGKTEGAVIGLLHYAATHANRALLVLAPYEAQVANIFQMLSKFIDNSLNLHQSIARKTLNPHRIQFANGSYILGFSAGSKTAARSDKVRGQDAHVIYIDEFDYIPDSDIAAVSAILISHPDCQLWTTSTPTGEHKRFYAICFTPDTPILTPTGFRSIEEIKAGDKVLSCGGHTDVVSKSFERKYIGDLIKISLKKSYRGLESTPEHPHLVKKGNRAPEFLAAKSVEVGDWVGVTIPKQTESSLPYPPLPDGYRTKTLDYSTNVRDLVDDGYLGLIDKRRRQAYEEACAVIDRANSDPETSRQLFRFLGYYLSEGSIKYSGDNLEYVAGVQTTHRLGEDAAKESESLARALFHCTVKRVEKPAVTTEIVEVYSRAASLLCKFLGGEHAESKVIHPSAYAHVDIGQAIETHWVGDGWTTQKGAKSCVTVSEELADQIWRYHLSNKTLCSISRSTVREGRKDAYTIYQLLKGTNQIKWFGSMPFLQVSDVSTSQYGGYVYNLETKLTHTYSANGFATHNCTDKNLGYKEFWFTSTEIPHWGPEMEEEMRREYNALVENSPEWDHEILAEFGEQVQGVFLNSRIDASLGDYQLGGHRPREGGIYILGVDWNKTAGTHMVIVEFFQGIFTLIDKIVVPKSEFTQTKAVELIIQLNEQWKFKGLYVDRGYGSTQVEMLKRHGLMNPGSNLHIRLRDFAMQEMTVIRDPATGAEKRMHTKPFLVNALTMALDGGNLVLPKTEDTRVVRDDMTMGVVQQMRNFKIEGHSVYGLPKYSQGQEHTLTALMLAIGGYTLENDKLLRLMLSGTVAMTPGPGQTTEDFIKMDLTASDILPKIQGDAEARRMEVRPKHFHLGDGGSIKQQAADRKNIGGTRRSGPHDYSRSNVDRGNRGNV